MAIASRFLRTEFGEFAARLSPDGRWIAYVSNESGRREIYVKKFILEPDGSAGVAAGKWIISRKGGVGMVHWRRDGKELYYLSADSKVMAVDVTATPDLAKERPNHCSAFRRRSFADPPLPSHVRHIEPFRLCNS